jgi:hypothetical protein
MIETQLREVEKERMAEFYYLKDLVRKVANDNNGGLAGKSIMLEDSQLTERSSIQQELVPNQKSA